MACGCVKQKITEYDKNREMAKTLSKEENEPYIIYMEEGKMYFDRLSCFNKAGRPGEIIEYISQ